jgi:outer membrane receptor protein involved in Fe transport
MTYPSIRKSVLSVAVATSIFCGAAAQAELEEVMVTAQKRSQSLADVPMSVSALTADNLNDAGIQTMDDVTRQIPVLEVQTNTSAAATTFRIRRVGNLGNIPSFEPAVAVFIDGAFRGRSIFGASDMFDVERIEILRGPQSTLYGKNATAGVIGIYTAAPGDAFEWKGEVTAGMYDGQDGDAGLYRFKGGISGPLTDDLSGSLGLSYTGNEETMGNAIVGGGEATSELDRYAVRGQLQWDVTDDLGARFILGTVQQDDNNLGSPDYFYDPNGALGGVILPTMQALSESLTCKDNDPHNRKACNYVGTTADVESYEATLLVDYALDNGWTLDSITSFDQYEFRGTQDEVVQLMGPYGKYHDSHDNEAYQQELRLTSAGGETIDWLGGLFYYHSEFDRGDNGNRAMFLSDSASDDPVLESIIGLPFGTPGQEGYVDGSQDTDYYAIYGQATWNINDKFSVTAGARWQREEKDAYINQWVNDESPSVISYALSPFFAESGDMDRDTDEVTWSITPQMFVSDDTMIFATVSHGFKSGGYNAGFADTPLDEREFDDEDIMHYEAGVKTEFLDGNMRLAVSAFYTETDDYQDGVFVGGQFKVGNAEEVELKGFELEGTALLTDRLTADFAVSYADLTYEKNLTGQCDPFRVPDGLNGGCDLSGEHPINAPEWKGNLSLMWEDNTSWGDYYIRGNWSWTDEYNTTFSADPNWTQDSYSWLTFRVGTRWDAYELVAWVDNATDEEVVTLDAVPNIFAVEQDASVQSYMMAPRSYGLTFRVNY